MTQAIHTKFLGPTDYRGARIKATCDAGSLTIGYPYQANIGEDAHRIAAEALRDKLGWTGQLIPGYLPDGSYAFVFLSEWALADMLTGPTSGGNAARLAAYVFGHGPEFDARPLDKQNARVLRGSL